MEKYNCYYQLKEMGVSLIFLPSEVQNEFCIEELKNKNIFHVTLFSVDEKHLEFIKKLMEVCAQNGCMDFAILTSHISEASLEIINLWAKELFSHETKLVVSSELALSFQFDDAVQIGNIVKFNNIYFGQGMNAAQFTYKEFQTIIPYLNALVEQVKSSHLENDLQKIIWVDNWFQKNIHYIKNKITSGQEGEYTCPEIDRQATVSDVLKNHFGVCEDIACSVALVMTKLGVHCQVLGDEGHAWNCVSVNGINYYWDCTHNITRNPHKINDALKASEYFDGFTLIGKDTFTNKYSTFDDVGINTSNQAFSRDILQQEKNNLARKGVEFVYNDTLKYKSFFKAKENLVV